MKFDVLHIKEWKNVFWGICFALFLNLEGIIAHLFAINTGSGYLNQFYSPFFLLLSLFCVSIIYYLRIKTNKNRVSILFFSTLLLSTLIISMSINNVDYSKLIRDLIYVWLIFVLFQIDEWKRYSKKIIDLYFIKSFTYTFLYILPLLFMIFTSMNDVERFSGWILSKPLFANMVMMVGIINFNSSQSRKRKHIIGITCLLLIIASGTRSPLLVFTIYYFYHFFIYRSGYNLKQILSIFGILGFVLIIALIAFLPEILAIVEAFGNVRAFSIDDIENPGSILSRITWYSVVWESLSKNYFIGGFGAGASENLLGLLTHFDFLRFWYDYTLFFSILFIWQLLYLFTIKRKFYNKREMFFECGAFILIILMIMTHNAFQNFSLVLLIMFFILIGNRSEKNNFSSSLHRVSIVAKPILDKKI